MNQEMQFAKALEDIRGLAREQGNTVSRKQVEETFGAIGIQGTQLEPVYEYLHSKNIGIDQPVNIEQVLSPDDRDYLSRYIQSLTRLPALSEGQRRAFLMAAMAGEEEGKERILQFFLPRVVDIAKLYSGQGMLLEDLIGEGNVALALGVEMLGCAEEPEEAEGMLAKMIMDAMEEAIGNDLQARQADRELAEKVNHVWEQAKELAESLQRKVTVRELAEEAGFSEEAIREALRLSGNKIEHIANDEEYTEGRYGWKIRISNMSARTLPIYISEPDSAIRN